MTDVAQTTTTIAFEICDLCCGSGYEGHPDDPSARCRRCSGTGGIPKTTDTRLRAYAINQLGCGTFGIDDEALCALANLPDPTAWKRWQETQATAGQWFMWRDPDEPEKLHVDQVEPDELGFIEMKFGCGLDYYPQCQPLRVADDVRDALQEAQRQRDARRGQRQAT